MLSLTLIQQITIWILPVLFAITVHEVAHGWVALKFGDPTALHAGRLTLNPINHIDWLGTVILPIVLLLIGGFVFGWAKPVPVNWGRLRNPKRDMAFVALAGPMANLLMAIFWAFIAKLGLATAATLGMKAQALFLMGKAGIMINIVFMVLNLLPLPPLDGSRVVSSLLPVSLSWKYNKLENYGIFVLLGLMALGALPYIVGPPVVFIETLIFNLFGL